MLLPFYQTPVPLSFLAGEIQLKSLCLTPSGIDQLTISSTPGNFLLGSGDATLIVDEGTVEKDTVVRYAVILHGPFVYSDGYKPASAVVYLNLERASLLKPIKLMLRHWCKFIKVNGEHVLKLLRAAVAKDGREDCYIFREVQDTSTATSTADKLMFTTSEPQALYGVEMKEESQARYNAIAFQKDLPDENMVMFKIQFMPDCLEWNKVNAISCKWGNIGL